MPLARRTRTAALAEETPDPHAGVAPGRAGDPGSAPSSHLGLGAPAALGAQGRADLLSALSVLPEEPADDRALARMLGAAVLAGAAAWVALVGVLI